MVVAAQRFSVGVLGAGPATQAIHLPVLGTMSDRFRIDRVVDVDAAVATQVAQRCGAQPSTDPTDVIDDESIDVVVICSPNEFHADQAVAACHAGKRAILCEKPLAVSREEAAAIAAAATVSGTHVVVGTMHVYDPAVRAAQAAWAELGEDAVLIRSSILLPPNDVFIDQAAQPAVPQPASAPTAPPDHADGRSAAAMIRMWILGLASHNVPLLRAVAPTCGTARFARHVDPVGYVIVTSDADRMIELAAYHGGRWPPRWTLEVLGRRHRLVIEFPPSYVLGGSARAELRGPHASTVFEEPVNGYEAEWAHLHDIVSGAAAPLVPVHDAVDDLAYALDLADQVDTLLGAVA